MSKSELFAPPPPSRSKSSSAHTHMVVYTSRLHPPPLICTISGCNMIDVQTFCCCRFMLWFGDGIDASAQRQLALLMMINWHVLDSRPSVFFF